MKREQVIQHLQKLIPSFQRKWNVYGGNLDDKKYGFLYRDETYSQERIKGDWESRITRKLPFEIPERFLEGITIRDEDTGDVLVSELTGCSKKGECRKVYLNITTFGAPYEHSYGSLEIGGPHWTKETGYVFGYLGNYYKDPGYDPRVQGDWNVDVCRIITKDDINSGADWYGWSAGDASPRFVSYSELVLTACWLVLMRVQGPVFLTTSRYSSDCGEVLEVDKKGNVKFYPSFYRNLVPGQEKIFIGN